MTSAGLLVTAATLKGEYGCRLELQPINSYYSAWQLVSSTCCMSFDVRTIFHYFKKLYSVRTSLRLTAVQAYKISLK